MEVQKINNPKRYAFDLDGTLNYSKDFKRYTDKEFLKAEPNWNIIKKLSLLYYDGNTIIIHTARPDMFLDCTKKWLELYAIPYHHLVMGKTFADVYVDDRAIHPNDLKVKGDKNV